MRLKRVRIFGFKTFADRTEFELGGDLVAVIGPNGCGKSNLVDAILWGLGEGNVKQLRAASSQDVIFSGSARRKAVGYAEVTLLFDNEDGALPAPTSEVAISRKLNRSGESDYAINGRSCRLRDIFDLLADSGLGRAGYAIVGQKDIDQALAASPEDRRAWVDEAAGVQRYRAKKVESIRRLTSAQNHLDRVNDIVSELESQREPLREEAEVARRYRNANDALRAVESGLLIREIAAATSEIEKANRVIGEAEALSKREHDLAASCESRARQTAGTLTVQEQELHRLREELQALTTAMHQADTVRQLAAQKLESLNSLEGTLFESAETAEERIAAATQERDQAQEEEVREIEALDEAKSLAAGAGDEAQALREALTRLEATVEAARAAQAERLRYEAEHAHRKERTRSLKREAEGIEETLPDLTAAIEEAEKALAEVAVKREVAMSELKAIEAELAQASDEEEQDAAEARKRLSERASLEGRRRGIEATLESHEGLQQGARAVLEMVAGGLLSASYTPVGEAIEVDREYAVAIETALGGAANDLIVDDPADAKAAIELLKRNRVGRATFQPIPLMRPQEVDRDLNEVLRRPGVVGRASELVETKAKFRPVIDSLLGNVVVVQSLDHALAMAKTRGWNRLVTLEGEIVHHRGGVTGGDTGKATYGLIQRKADLVDIEERLSKLDAADSGFEKRQDKRDAKRTQLVGRRQKCLADMEGVESDHREAAEWVQKLQAELTDTQRSLARVRDELTKLGIGSEAPPEVDVAALEAERDKTLKALALRSADADQAEARIREAEARASQAQLRRHLAERRLEAAKEAESARQRKVQNLGPERRKAEAEIETAEKHLAKLVRERDSLETQLSTKEAERHRLQEELASLNEQARTARYAAQTAGDGIHRAELDRARAEAKKASSVSRLLEEYGITEAQALEEAPGLEIPSDAATVVSRLRRELRAMGEVNLGAIEAYERLTTRYDELETQRADILAGMKEVQAGIRELDALTRDKFLDVFEQVQGAFAERFRSIFEGGEGQVRLTDPENVLESGIEIEVTLPGKRRQPLALLSGGERSLCATAFLFALLAVKPSPLVVLDEVDAPLDGRNVERFVSLLSEFSGQTQFVVITHNPVTIESTSDWLGVTMNEPGVSTLVPVRLPSRALELVESAPTRG